MRLDISDPGPGHVASAYPNFACACNLAGSEDEPPGFVSVSHLYSEKAQFSGETD